MIYVVPHHQRQGIGRQLLRACVKRLVEDEHHSMVAWTFDKGFATRFYENMSGVEVGNKQSDIAGASYDFVAYGWDDLQALAT